VTAEAASPGGPPGRRSAPWWSRPGLELVDGRLSIAGSVAEALARENGSTIFFNDRPRFP
jgi:hypothetical protein